MKYLNQKTCEECRSRVKPMKQNLLCDKQDCKFKKSSLNKYWRKHQLYPLSTKLHNLVWNIIFKHSCQLSSFNRCEICLQLECEEESGKIIDVLHKKINNVKSKKTFKI